MTPASCHHAAMLLPIENDFVVDVTEQPLLQAKTLMSPGPMLFSDASLPSLNEVPKQSCHTKCDLEWHLSLKLPTSRPTGPGGCDLEHDK